MNVKQLAAKEREWGVGGGVGQCLLVVAIMDSLLPRSIKVSSVAFWTQTERERR